MADVETWYWNETLNIGSSFGEIINFESRDSTFKSISVEPYDNSLEYDATAGEGQIYKPYSHGRWMDASCRIIKFLESPAGDLLRFLETNAVKLGSPGISRIEYGGETLINLTADTITADTLQEGVTAHDSSGAFIIGTANIPEREQRTLDLDMASGNQIITPTYSIALMDKVTIMKPSTMLPENIKKDVNIGGVVGTLESGGQISAGETWFLHRDFDRSKEKEIQAKFTSGGKTYNSIKIGGSLASGDVNRYEVFYGTETILTDGHIFGSSDARRRITFMDSPTGDLLTWLNASATKQPNDAAELITIRIGISNDFNGLYLYSGVTSEQINIYTIPRDYSRYADAPNESTVLLLIDKDVYKSSVNWLEEEAENNPEIFLMKDIFNGYNNWYYLALFKATEDLSIG